MTTGSAVTEARRPKTINILPAELVNQIAAGEVIERPASVVKELVENALDAGARRLTIDLESGGMDLIRVTDDGCGILEAELPLAVQNHATSKLQSLSDLFAIASLGFRGEALASIASISQFRLASRTADADGAELAVDGGKLGATQPVALPIGTRVEVRNLFFNVPARRKFLKSDRSEIAAVTQQLTRLALSRPDVFITLRNDGKQILTVPPSDEPRERIARLTTQVVAEEILAVGPIDAKKVTMSLRGYVSPFNLTRADTRGQFFFLNNRSIRDPLLLSAVKDSYLHLLPPRRHPWVFLWLDVEPEDVDVNVHPTKSEVRFRYSSDVYALIVSSIKSALSSLAEAPMLTGGSASERAPVTLAPPPRPSNEFSFPMRGDVIEQMGQGPGRAAAADLKPRSAEMPFRSASERSFELRVNPGPRPSFAFPERGSGFEAKIPEESAAPREGASEEELCDDPSCSPSVPSDDRAFASTPGEANSSVDPGPAPVSRLNPFFQIHNAFIVEETREGVKIIDQHALHERILYHQIVQRLAAGRLETQRLLFPVQSELEMEASVLFHDVLPVLTELGFELELDERSLKILAVPRFVKAERAVEIVQDLLGEKHPSFVDDEVQALDQAELHSKAFATPEGRTILHTMAASLACKAAVKFGMPLSHDEIAALLTRRHEVDRAYCCPHGRPTTLSLSMGELRRRFGRPG